MRILHVCHRYWPSTGGAERYFQMLSESLARDGHEVTVFTTDALDVETFWRSGRRIPVALEVHNGVRIRRFTVRRLPLHLPLALALALLPSRRLELLLRPPSPLVPDLLRAQPAGYDIVHATSLPYNSIMYAGQHLARKMGARMLVTPHVHIGEPGSKRAARLFASPAQLALIAQSDVVIARTPRERQYLLARGLDPARVHTVPLGIEPTDLAGGDGARFRHRHGLAPDEPIVFSIGTRAFDKGTPHVVHAMRELWQRGRQATLVLAGSSQPHFRRFWRGQPSEVHARTLLLDDISESDKRDLLAAGHVFVMPSRADTFGIVFLEAWVYGVPVIGANAGGIPDVIEDGRDGLIVPFGDVHALRDSIESLLDDPVRRAALGAAGRAKVMRRWTWPRVFEQLRVLYGAEAVGA